jgi:hypothetical protein
MRGGARRARAGAEPRPGRWSGEFPGVSVAAALPWAVSHAKARVMQSSRSALTRAIDEFATDTRWEYAVASEEKWDWP